jgi:hypothetical protein
VSEFPFLKMMVVAVVVVAIAATVIRGSAGPCSAGPGGLSMQLAGIVVLDAL